MQKSWADVVCLYDTVQGLVEMLIHDYGKYGRMLRIWWSTVIVWIGVTTVSNQLKSSWGERSKTEMAGLTGA